MTTRSISLGRLTAIAIMAWTSSFAFGGAVGGVLGEQSYAERIALAKGTCETSSGVAFPAEEGLQYIPPQASIAQTSTMGTWVETLSCNSADAPRLFPWQH